MTDEMILVLAKMMGLDGARIEHPKDGVMSILFGKGEKTYGVDFKTDGLSPEHIKTGLATMQRQFSQERLDQLNGKT